MPFLSPLTVADRRPPVYCAAMARMFAHIAFGVLLVSAPAGLSAHTVRCPRDSVQVGPTCVHKYEASIWQIPAEQTQVIRRVKQGLVTHAELVAAGARQLGAFPLGNEGCTGDEYGPGFPRNGNWTEPLYAVSIPGVLPSTCVTWFQAEQACRLSGKRLLTNQEWQAAAAGTPDPGEADDQQSTCVTRSATEKAMPTGSRSRCVSRWGAYDMIGNVWEWVAEWSSVAMDCGFWDEQHGNDISCIGRPLPSPGATIEVEARELISLDPLLPSAWIRGGNLSRGAQSGQFAIFAGANPSNVSLSTGFRCGR